MSIETERLHLRNWKEEDLGPFAELNRDPRVMEFFPEMLIRAESDAFVTKIKQELSAKKYGLWAVEIKESQTFIGFVGLHEVSFKAEFTPAVEIGWRLAYDHWGKGYAYEAAAKVLEYGLEFLSEIISFTATQNLRSQKLMKKLGMTKQGEFMHPNLPEDHPLARHVFFRIESSRNRGDE